MEQPQQRFHGEVKVQRNGTEIRVNIFDDNRERLYQEILIAIAQFSPDIKPATAAPPAPAPKPAPMPLGTGIPKCPACRTDKNVESRQFVDADTGETMERFKCKGCGRWIGKATPVAEELPY